MAENRELLKTFETITSQGIIILTVNKHTKEVLLEYLSHISPLSIVY